MYKSLSLSEACVKKFEQACPVGGEHVNVEFSKPIVLADDEEDTLLEGFGNPTFLRSYLGVTFTPFCEQTEGK